MSWQNTSMITRLTTPPSWQRQRHEVSTVSSLSLLDVYDLNRRVSWVLSPHQVQKLTWGQCYKIHFFFAADFGDKIRLTASHG